MGQANQLKSQVLEWIEQDRQRLVGFFAQFVSKPSPNPPGDAKDIDGLLLSSERPGKRNREEMQRSLVVKY